MLVALPRPVCEEKVLRASAGSMSLRHGTSAEACAHWGLLQGDKVQEVPLKTAVMERGEVIFNGQNFSDWYI